MSKRVGSGIRNRLVEIAIRIRCPSGSNAVHHYQEGARHQPTRPMTSGPSSPALANAHRREKRPLGNVRSRFVRSMQPGKQVAFRHVRSKRDDVREAHRRINAVTLAHAPAAEAHDRHADRVAVKRRKLAGNRRSHFANDLGYRQARPPSCAELRLDLQARPPWHRTWQPPRPSGLPCASRPSRTQ